MKRISIIILALLITFVSNSQSYFTIKGKVTDVSDNTDLPGVTVTIKGDNIGTVTDIKGEYQLNVPDSTRIIVFSFIGYETKEMAIKGKKNINVSLQPQTQDLEEVVVAGYGSRKSQQTYASDVTIRGLQGRVAGVSIGHKGFRLKRGHNRNFNTENYAPLEESGFKSPEKEALSTFSIDVDKASYSNIRRFIMNGEHPPKDAVRIEEMINYFSYDYQEPQGDHPFAISTELAECPWNKDHHLLQIGLKGKSIQEELLPPSNLVFLIDVSGSMDSPNKLALLKKSFHLLTNKLREEDRVAIVVYAGAAGLRLPSTPGNKKDVIMDAINQLEAGGSTAGGAGITLAYQTAEKHFLANGNNRVILATDGDFNIGVSSNGELKRLIEEYRNKGIFLSVLGFGMGNYKDNKMELLADKGNGNYAYIDNLLEAKKVLVSEFGGTFFTIAKDVKIQVEFNPKYVHAYRLIGYENRLLEAEDFNNDKKDAGEMGAGHMVTALYEIIPQGRKNNQTAIPEVDPLKYQKANTTSEGKYSKEMATLKFRYKRPKASRSIKTEITLPYRVKKLEDTNDNFRFAAAVAAWGMILRESEFINSYSLLQVENLARQALGIDYQGYRHEFIRLLQTSPDLIHISRR